MKAAITLPKQRKFDKEIRGLQHNYNVQEKEET